MEIYNQYTKDPLEAIDPREETQCLVALEKNKSGRQAVIHILYTEFDKEKDDFGCSSKGPFRFKFRALRNGKIKVEFSENKAYTATVADESTMLTYAVKISKIFTLIEIKKERKKNITPKQIAKIEDSYQDLVAEITDSCQAAAATAEISR